MLKTKGDVKFEEAFPFIEGVPNVTEIDGPYHSARGVYDADEVHSVQ